MRGAEQNEPAKKIAIGILCDEADHCGDVGVGLGGRQRRVLVGGHVTQQAGSGRVGTDVNSEGCPG